MDKPSLDSKRDLAAADPMTSVIQVDPSLLFSSRGQGSETAYIASDPRTGKFYRFGAREYHAASLMDGTRTLSQVHHQLERDGLMWTVLDVVAFARELAKHRLASVASLSVVGSVDPGSKEDAVPDLDATRPAVESAVHSHQPLDWFSSAVRMMGGFLTQRFPLLDGDRVASFLLPAFGCLFGRPAMVAWIVLVASGMGVVWTHVDAFSVEVRRLFDQHLWLLMAGLWCILKFVHECGHAVCAKRHGVRVGPMGILLFLFAPLAYVDVTDAWKLPRRRDRVQIALAGVYLELAIGAAAAWLWWLSPIGLTKHLAAQVFLVAGPATLLVNANPLLRLDGYYVVGDLLEIPNLRTHGRKRLGSILESLLFQTPLYEIPLAGWRRDFAVLHAFCSVVFQAVWMTGLVLAVSAWAKGLGIVIAIVAAVLWALLPLVRWMHKIWTLQPNEGWVLNFYQRRLLTFCSLVCLSFQYFSVHTSPLARRVPVVVRYQNEQIARAPVDAFVVSVFVQCGERVRRGKLLMELEQPELVVRRDQMIDQREVELAKSIQHRQRGEIASSTAATHNVVSLGRQIEEIEEQLRSMRIVATRDGKITTPVTDRLLGTFVHRGDEVLRVSDPQEKEILAIVAEDSLDAYQKASEAGGVAKIRLRGGITITAPLTGLQPSASRVLPHRALAVTAGGPLAVQTLDSLDSNELVHPQLRSVIPLNALTSLSVHSGQSGRLTIPDDRTVISRIWDQLMTR